MAVEISKPVVNLNSSTPLPLVPTINNLVPSVLNSMPNGSSSIGFKYLDWFKVAVEMSNAEDKLRTLKQNY